jgi:hypothetical protein
MIGSQILFLGNKERNQNGTSEPLINQTDIRALSQISLLIFLSFLILALGKVNFALEIKVASKTHFKPKHQASI